MIQGSSHRTCVPLTSSQCRRHREPLQDGQTARCLALEIRALSSDSEWILVRRWQWVRPWHLRLQKHLLTSSAPGTGRRFLPAPCWRSSQASWSSSSYTWGRWFSCCGSSSPADRPYRSCGRKVWRRAPQTPPDRWSSWTDPQRGVALLESSCLWKKRLISAVTKGSLQESTNPVGVSGFRRGVRAANETEGFTLMTQGKTTTELNKGTVSHLKF